MENHKFETPTVIEIDTYRLAHKVTPDTFIDSGILAEVIELPVKEEPEDLVA